MTLFSILAKEIRHQASCTWFKTKHDLFEYRYRRKGNSQLFVGKIGCSGEMPPATYRRLGWRCIAANASKPARQGGHGQLNLRGYEERRGEQESTAGVQSTSSSTYYIRTSFVQLQLLNNSHKMFIKRPGIGTIEGISDPSSAVIGRAFPKKPVARIVPLLEGWHVPATIGSPPQQ